MCSSSAQRRLRASAPEPEQLLRWGARHMLVKWSKNWREGLNEPICKHNTHQRADLGSESTKPV